MRTKYLLPAAILFCVSLIIANITAGKLWALPGGIILTAGVLVFPIVYIVGDVIPEVYGLRAARRIIWLGFAANLFAVLIFLITLALPYPPFWSNQDAFQVVLGFTPRLLIASFIAYLVGTNVNASIMVQMKAMTKSRWLWTRTITSTIFGEGIDSALFMTIAFYGILPNSALPALILSQWAFKVLYEVLVTPVTYLVIGWFKKRETPPSPTDGAQDSTPAYLYGNASESHSEYTYE